MIVEEALSLTIASELTKSQYKSLHRTALSHGHELYSCCNRIALAKNADYPEGIKITEAICEENLQALLDHTVLRIIVCLPTTSTKISKKLILL